MIAGVVSEGSTDFPVLKELLFALCPEIEHVLPLQPDMDALDMGIPQTGWTGVKAWCEAYGPWLDAYLSAGYGNPIEVLVIHVDADIAKGVGLDLPCPPAEAICAAVADQVRQWLSRTPPIQVIIAVPAMRIEAWLCAALLPTTPAIECESEPERLLAKRKLLPKDMNGVVVKDPSLYQNLAPRIAEKLPKVRNVCSAAERFAKQVEQVCKATV